MTASAEGFTEIRDGRGAVPCSSCRLRFSVPGVRRWSSTVSFIHHHDVPVADEVGSDEPVDLADVILNILSRRRDPEPAATILTPDALRLRHAPIADCARYDGLRSAS